MDALVYACEGDWDRAINLSPGEDYDTAELDYSNRTHSVPAAKSSNRLSASEKILFIRIRKTV